MWLRNFWKVFFISGIEENGDIDFPPCGNCYSRDWVFKYKSEQGRYEFGCFNSEYFMNQTKGKIRFPKVNPPNRFVLKTIEEEGSVMYIHCASCVSRITAIARIRALEIAKQYLKGEFINGRPVL